jgi:hypothetical protein
VALNIDPYALATLEMLATCSELSAGQLSDLDRFLEKHKGLIEESLVQGLSSEDNGAYIALKLLKLQSDRLGLMSAVTTKKISVQKPLEESRFALSIVGQVFHCLAEWMKANSIDRITVDSLPDLEEFVSLDIAIQNGYRPYLKSHESL